MPPQAYALVSLFLACSLVVGVIAAWAVGRLGGPRAWWAAVLPVIGGFLAFYLVGHRFGISIGPQVELFGFQVALLGDIAIGFAIALLVASVQALAVGAVAKRRIRQPSPHQPS